MPTKTKQSETQKIPKLRFAGFCGEWEEKKLGEVADFSKGKGISKNDIVENGKNKCIRYGELYTKYNEIIDEVVSQTNVKKEDSILSGKDDLIIPSSGETLLDIATVSCVKNKNIIFGGDLNIIRLKENNTGDFFAYYLSNYKKKEIAKFGQGHSVVHLYSTHFKNLKINLPQREEQQKIAEFLEATDEWIENLRAQKENLESYKKGMMQKIFSQEVRFKLALSEVEGDNEGNNFAEWEEKKLGEVCEYKNGGSFESKVIENGKYNLITLNSVDINGNIKDTHKTVDGASWFLQKNDLIMVLSDVAHGNFLGLVDIIPENDKYVLNQRMGLLRKKDNQADLNFLRTYINKNQRYFKLHGQGSSQQNLSKGDILKFKIPMPRLLEQQKIAEFLTSIDNLINSKQQQITQAEEWKNGLMQGLFV